MKNLIKILTLVALMFSLNVKAQIVVGTTMATSNSVTNLNTLLNIPTNGITITKITVAGGPGTIASTFFFYDWFASFQTNLWQTNIFRYTNATIVDPFTNSIIFTNSLGRVDTNFYIGRAVFYTNVVNSNTTSSVPAIGSITVAPSTTYSIDVNWIIAQGFAVRGTNNQTASFITIEYR